MMTRIKTAKEIDAMREGGQMLATVLSVLKQRAVVGISTKELADVARAELKALGGEPSVLGYQGFPDVLCTSVNDEVVHGIPKPTKILKDGDVIGLDFCVTYKGMITDSAISVAVGQVSNSLLELLSETERAMYAGINTVKNGTHVGDIGAAVQSVLDKKHYGIVRDLVGHGVGHELHEDPNIPNVGQTGKGPILKTGMTIAIEPMATLGAYDVFVDSDRWTIKTRDGSMATHFEHTVLITDDGVEILTQL
jgi:methionyl aminopeptidase